MRALNSDEIDSAGGGFGYIGAGIGAVTGGLGAWYQGGSATQIGAATLLGGMSGFAGNMAGSAAAGGLIIRGGWGARSVGYGFLSGAGSAGREEDL